MPIPQDWIIFFMEFSYSLSSFLSSCPSLLRGSFAFDLVFCSRKRVKTQNQDYFISNARTILYYLAEKYICIYLDNHNQTSATK